MAVHHPSNEPTRRVVLTGALAVGAIPILAACGSNSDGGGSAGGGTGDSTGGIDNGGASDDQPSSGQPDGGSGDGEPVLLAAVADVPEGGGVVLEDEELVLTQPSDGQFRCFSAICTHQGCPVAGVANGTINCPCHGSMFDIDTGEVLAGPAPSPLPEKPIIVSGKEILLAQQ
ncbi:MAG: Rieske (2Fe-2S) protein [Nocardioidaceae bacterium]